MKKKLIGRLAVFISIFTYCCLPLYIHGSRWKSRDTTELATNRLWNHLINYHPAEKKITVIVTAKNVADWYDLNLDSIFAQEYKNFRIIYIDDCSTDGTPDLVETHIQKNKWQDRVTLIRNKEWKSQLANHYTAAHLCDDDEIMINVDCDDWLSHKYVLSLINKIYSNNDQVWVTCGASLDVPLTGAARDPIPSEVIAQNCFREDHGKRFNWAWWHPRTFYAWIFKQIKLQDLLLASSFKPLTPSPDSAFMYPILEMSGHHTLNIPDIIYLWNMRNPLSQWMVAGVPKLMEINRIVAGWEKYRNLSEPVIHRNKKYLSSKADMILICTSNSTKLEEAIKAFSAFKNLNKISIIYQPLGDNIKAYEALKNKFAHINFIPYNQKEFSSVPRLLESILSSAQEHVVLTDCKNIVNLSVDINNCIRELERTFAHGFYLGLAADRHAIANHIPEYAPLSENMGAWQFDFAQNEGKLAYSLDTVLYRKADVLKALLLIKQVNFDDFAPAWLKLNENNSLVGRKAGLFLR